MLNGMYCFLIMIDTLWVSIISGYSLKRRTGKEL